tara:strand:- start:123 stop:473 length:351 start_codon:yes stop_codon:yes gene_type:complete
MKDAIRNQKLGEHISIGIKHGTIGDMLFIFDDDGYVSATSVDAYDYNKDQNTWTNAQGQTMQEKWRDGILVTLPVDDLVDYVDNPVCREKYHYYKFKGDIKVRRFNFYGAPFKEQE